MYSQFYSNGKLLITGEYLVLVGARALALPTRYGQSMEVRASNKGYNSWTSLVLSKKWITVLFDNNFQIIKSSNTDKAIYLMRILKAAYKINSQFFNKKINYSISTNLTFQNNWGLGSSSTLISNIAYWSGVDPFQLFSQVTQGSGYDIACARADGSIIYQLKNYKPNIEQVKFQPRFKDQLFFLYLNKKQNSFQEVKKFKQQAHISKQNIKEISQLTELIGKTNSLKEFKKYLDQHEEIIAKILKRKRIKEIFFKDFSGSIKSLGAWGGDFALVASDLSEKDIKKYFIRKGFKTIINYSEMVLDGNIKYK